LSSNPSAAANDLILAIDIGSSWCKAAYIDASGRFLSQGRSPTRNATLTSEEAIDLHWDALVRAVREATDHLVARTGASPAPAAINFSCRGMIGVALDRTGHPMLLADTPTVVAKFRETSSMLASEGEYADEMIRYGYGSRLGFLLGWLREHEPDVWSRIERVGALRDFIAYRLAGAWVTDLTIGPGDLAWPDSIVEQSGLPRSAFPEIVEPTDFAGELSAEASAALGLPAGIPVASGLHDGAAANMGVGAILPGTACLTLGTNFSLRAVTGPRLRNYFSYVILPGRWAWVDNVPYASARIDTVVRALAAAGEPIESAYQSLGRAAAEVSPGCDGFRLPEASARDLVQIAENAEAALACGIEPPVIYRATLEQNVFDQRCLLERVGRSGVQPSTFIATGGSVQNRLLVEIIATVFDRPIIPGEPEAGLLGAMIAASAGLGWYPSVDDAVQAIVRVGRPVGPRRDQIEQYEQLWEAWLTRRRAETRS
jgi:sugar (pentulose or hexulose) kinase